MSAERREDSDQQNVSNCGNCNKVFISWEESSRKLYEVLRDFNKNIEVMKNAAPSGICFQTVKSEKKGEIEDNVLQPKMVDSDFCLKVQNNYKKDVEVFSIIDETVLW